MRHLIDNVEVLSMLVYNVGLVNVERWEHPFLLSGIPEIFSGNSVIKIVFFPVDLCRQNSV